MDNVLIVADCAPRFGGNFVESLVSLQDEVIRRGGCAFFAFPEAASAQRWVKNFINVGFFAMNSGSMLSLLNKAIYECQCGIVHAHFFGRQGAWYLTRGIGKSVKVVWHFHNHVNQRRGLGRIPDQIITQLAYGTGSAIGVSEAVSDSVRSIIKMRCTTIYNGLQTDRLDDFGEQNAIPRSSDKIRCLIMANHYERKGVDLAVQAVQKLNDEGHPAVLYACCDNGNEMTEWVQQTLCKRGCHFNIGNVIPVPTRNDIAAYYAATDVFLSPSREEGFTWAVDEAAYCGVPVVLTRCSGQGENTVPGFLWVSDPNVVSDSKVVSELAASITVAASISQSKRREFQNVAREYIRTHFSLSNWSQNVCDYFESL